MSGWASSRRAPALAAVLWVAYGVWALAGVPSRSWRWRDDAVITLSHARGLVAFGHPAVSAAAERVEGTSAPLQMFAAALYYRLGGEGWETFLDAQVVVGFAVSGWFVARILQLAYPDARTSTVVIAAWLVGVVGFSAWPALGWFGSGMENSVLVPLLFAVVACSVGLLVDERSRGIAAGVAFGLAGVARVEFAVFLVPALILVVLLARGRRHDAVRMVVIAGACWSGVHLWRYLTFGSILPNTAVAQDKTGVELVNLVPIAVVTVSCAVVMWCWHHDLRRVCASAVFAVAGSAVIVAAWRTDNSTSFGGLPTPLVLGAAAIGVISALGWIVGAANRCVWTPVLAVGFAPIAQQLLLGPARLDASRVSAQSLPVLSLGVALAIIHASGATGAETSHQWRAATGSFNGGRLVFATVVMGTIIVGGAVLASIALSRASNDSKAYYLCCDIPWHTTVLDQAEQHRVEHGLPRSIVATADLGKYSFDKSVIVVDLGDLGDALMAELRADRPDLIAAYLNHVQPPDVVETHGIWACSVHRAWLDSTEFAERYELARLDARSGQIEHCPHHGDFQYYRRTPLDLTYPAETALAAALAQRPDHGPVLVGAAAHACATPGDPWSCQWIRRAIQRSSPELREAASFTKTVDTLTRVSPTGELDALILTTPPGWAPRAADLIIEQLDNQHRPP